MFLSGFFSLFYSYVRVPVEIEIEQCLSRTQYDKKFLLICEKEKKKSVAYAIDAFGSCEKNSCEKN